MMTEKIEQFWRDANADDVAKVVRGEKVEARFRDRNEYVWNESRYLGGFDATSVKGYFWISEKAGQWRQCQVYDPPQWWLDKPDPGEGFRLLEKFPPEDLQKGDEVWVVDSWVRSWRANHDEYAQKEKNWYRRRIETNNPELPDSSRSEDNIPTGWRKIPDDKPRLASDAYWSQGAKDWVIIGDSRVEYANRDKWPAIRQRRFVLVEDESYSLPKGLTLEVHHESFWVI